MLTYYYFYIYIANTKASTGLNGGAVAGIAVGVLVVILLVVTGVCMLAALCFKCKSRPTTSKYTTVNRVEKDEGLGNPNYDEIDYIQSPQDYEVPRLLSGTAVQNYVNVPFQREKNSSVNRSECDSGIYSYVIVNRRTSYDSNFLQSTNGSLELPVVIAADPCGIVTNRRSATDNSDYYS